jgi:hypothetical protein
MKYENLTNSSTYNAWKQLLSKAQTSVDLAVLYWNLNETGYTTSWQVKIDFFTKNKSLNF